MQLLVLICVIFVTVTVCVNVRLVDGYAPVQDNGHVGKKGASYADYARNEDPEPSNCATESDYEISQNDIIRTKDSKANGATFVATLLARTFDACLQQCCEKEKCDTTIFVQEIDAYAKDQTQTNCFLFECRPGGETGPNLCLFTYHLGYISSIKKSHGGFQNPVRPEPVRLRTTEVQLPTTSQSPVPELEVEEPLGGNAADELETNCGRDKFECDSGQCINLMYVCNNIIDCPDKSDEYGCSPLTSYPKEQQTYTSGETAPAPVEDTNNKPEPAVTVVAPPPNNNMTTHSSKVNLSDVIKTEANYDTHPDELVDMLSGGGGGMPPASSAILPLVIGLIITVCLLLMVGCRLRFMNQRLRYGRLKTSANDADYLINGMYL